MKPPKCEHGFVDCWKCNLHKRVPEPTPKKGGEKCDHPCAHKLEAECGIICFGMTEQPKVVKGEPNQVAFIVNSMFLNSDYGCKDWESVRKALIKELTKALHQIRKEAIEECIYLVSQNKFVYKDGERKGEEIDESDSEWNEGMNEAIRKLQELNSPEND